MIFSNLFSRCNSRHSNDISAKNKNFVRTKDTKGITLVALVVTIVVLLILAGVTIMMLFGENGIIKKAEKAKEETNQKTESDQEKFKNLIDQMNSALDGSGTGGEAGGGDEPTESLKVADNINKVISTTQNTDLTDANNNKITIPEGFKIVPNGTSNVKYSYLGTNNPAVQDGIVIENEADGNQFVWVPVGTINNKSDDTRGVTTTIKLGRYSNFTVTDGVLPTSAQEATEDCYNTPVLISNYHFEVSDSFAGDGTYKAASEYGNTKATNLQEWIKTTLANGGYYIARYEARKNDDTNPTKAASVAGKRVWLNITQPNAAIAAKATYPAPENNTTGYNYYSDLVNSYAWDTAIIFIEAFANSTYANINNSKNGEGNNALMTTGANTDNVCNINAMSGNVSEWSTETSTDTPTYGVCPCTIRGGSYSTTYGKTSSFTKWRTYSSTNSGNNSSGNYSFRPLLYVK